MPASNLRETFLPDSIEPSDSRRTRLQALLHDLEQTLTDSLAPPYPSHDRLAQVPPLILESLEYEPRAALEFAHLKIHSTPFRDVEAKWLRLYAEGALCCAREIIRAWAAEVGRIATKSGSIGDATDGGEKLIESTEQHVDKLLDVVDRAVIISGVEGRARVVESIFEALDGVLQIVYSKRMSQDLNSEHPQKRRKLSESDDGSSDGHFLKYPPAPSALLTPLPPHFAPQPSRSLPDLRCPIARSQVLSFTAFQTHLLAPSGPNPILIEGALAQWPAVSSRPWSSPAYLLSRTMGGRRLVPIEVGAKYTDEEWGQRIEPFGEFVGRVLQQSRNSPSSNGAKNLEHTNGNEKENGSGEEQATDSEEPTVYLAQHDLFTHIPSLRADVAIPDYCYCDPPPDPLANPPSTSSRNYADDQEDEDENEDVQLNAWFGPAGTVSPLHTDPHHNILCQVVGWKYVRLYAPSQTSAMYPRGTDERGVDMGNTSSLDLDEGVALFENTASGADDDGLEKQKKRESFEERFPLFKDAVYEEAILGPGECLYIPKGWWHYVRSLSTSFSVSFWWG